MELVHQLTKAGLGKYVPRILELARPSIALEPRRTRARLPLGASRLGGTPDLAAGFVWPRWGDRALSFLAQIDLADVPENDRLPREGRLAFFYEAEEQPWGFDPGDRGAAHVEYIDAAAGLAPVAAPRGATVFAPCSLSFSATVDLPAYEDLVADDIWRDMTEEELDGYGEVTAAMRGDDTYHHLLGHSQNVQGDMRVECQLVSNGFSAGTPAAYAAGAHLAPGGLDWELLLQLDSHEQDGPGWMWGDAGRLYFWLRRQDLAARQFDRGWVVLQCH